VKLYIYRISDREYGAGTGLKECEERGSIVEQWSLNTPEQAKFLATHGTSYGNASELVTRIANAVHDLMLADPTFRPQSTEISAPTTVITPEVPMQRLGVLKRIRSWFFAR